MSAVSKLSIITCLSCSVLGKTQLCKANDGVSTLPSNSLDCVQDVLMNSGAAVKPRM